MDRSLKQTLLISGALLFLVGLLSGAAVPYMHNPRMGVSAHLAGVQSALFLLVVGAAWNHVRLPVRLGQTACWSGVGSMYGFWLALQLAAVWGTSRATPIAGEGFQALAWKETLVEILLQGVSVAALIAAALVLVGFWKGRVKEAPPSGS